MHDMHTLASQPVLARNDRAWPLSHANQQHLREASYRCGHHGRPKGGRMANCLLKMRSLRVENVIVRPVALVPSASTST